MADQPIKVVVITGASAGVGRATALAFAQAGAAVALFARGSEGLKATAAEIATFGGKALVLPGDVADPTQVDNAADRVEEILGPIDVWVNNAMVTVFSRVVEMTPDEYRRVTEVTYLGAVHGTLAALRYMRQRNRGTIIQVGSALAYRGIPLQSAYCGAKFALRGFTESLRVELMHENSAIHLTMVQLAAFNTPQFDWAKHRLDAQPMPLPPIFQPEVAAQAIVWSARHKRRELNVGFPALKVILGNKVLPRAVDYMACKQAIDGQMDESMPPPDPERKDNLFTPIQGDFGAHGRFDSQARDSSFHLFLSQHRAPVALVSIAVVSGLAFALAQLF